MVLNTVSSPWHVCSQQVDCPQARTTLWGCVIGGHHGQGGQAARDNVTGDMKAPPTLAVVEYAAYGTVPSTRRKGAKLCLPPPPCPLPSQTKRWRGPGFRSEHISTHLLCGFGHFVFSSLPWEMRSPALARLISPSQPLEHPRRTKMCEMIHKVKSGPAGWREPLDCSGWLSRRGKM